jgi:hypothetical protein
MPVGPRKRAFYEYQRNILSLKSENTGWVIKESEFESQLGKKFSLLRVLQTESGVNPSPWG